MIKTYIIIIFYILSSVFQVHAKETEIDNIVAIVNDQIILNSDVKQMLFLLKQEGKDVTVPLRNNFLKDKVIQKLIIDSLMLQEANKKNIIITKKQINRVIQNIALKKNISVHQLKQYLLSNKFKHHFSYKSYRKNIEKLLKIKIIQNYELRNRIKITDYEVNELFKEIVQNHQKFQKINLSYILLPVYKQDSKQIIQNKNLLAKNFINQLNKGCNFEKLYMEYKQKNNLLIKKMFWMNFTDIQNNFLKTIKIFKKGQILGPFLKDKGLYILRINDFVNNNENIVTEFHIQHCLIKPSIVLKNSESKKNIFDIYQKITSGIYNFNYAVKNFSQDFDSSHKNGDLGWVSRDFAQENFNDILFILKKNEISKPIKSRFGWHIIKLLDTRQVDKFYDTIKKQAYNIIFNRKIILEKNNWINELKKQSYIEILS